MLTDKDIEDVKHLLGIDILSMNTDRNLFDYDYIFMWSNKKTKTIKCIKNMSKDWLINKLTVSNYKNLQRVFEKLNIGGNIYYTSFGFSYCLFMQSTDKFNHDTNIIKNKLNELGVKYTTEYSDANWVYRFKISKSKENIDLINAI